MEPIFRACTGDDLPALVQLVNSAYRGDASRQGWTTEADLLEGQRTDLVTLGEELQHADPMLLVEQDGRLVGCIKLEDGARHGHADAVYLGMVTIAPSEQGTGLGKVVLAEAERIARGRGRLATVMTVIAQRAELIAFYARRGYQPTGEREPFPYGDERFGIPRRDDLEFLVLRKELQDA